MGSHGWVRFQKYGQQLGTATSLGAAVKAEQPGWVLPLPFSCVLSPLPFPFTPVLSASGDHSNPICSCCCSADCSSCLSEQIVSQQVLLSKNPAIHSVTVTMTLKKMMFLSLFGRDMPFQGTDISISFKMLEKENKRKLVFCLALFYFLIKVELLCNKSV